jgi:hypothetical protein
MAVLTKLAGVVHPPLPKWKKDTSEQTIAFCPYVSIYLQRPTISHWKYWGMGMVIKLVIVEVFH